MNQTLIAIAILASFLIPATSIEAQISIQREDGTTLVTIDGTDNNDVVYILESYGGVGVYLYDAKENLVDSKYFPGIFQFPQPSSPGGGGSFGGGSSFGGGGSSPFGLSFYGETQEPEFIVVVNLYGGDDFYYNNAYLFDADIVDCGAGSDTVYAGPGESWVSSELSDRGQNTIFGGGGDDWLIGGAGNDLIAGGDGNDIINGNEGNDVIYGEAGDDDINGNNGNDTLYGNAGDDDIDGGRGFDRLYGGTGNDSFSGDRPKNIISDIDG